jgi:mono/diheme cytochrome c family protein
MVMYKFLVLVLLAAITVVFTHCGSPFSSQSQLIWKSNVYGGADEASYNAFEATVFPILRTNCASCHGTTQAPLHSQEDVRKAHDVIMEAQKVNFSNPGGSRLVRKLRDESHNCWSDCQADADEMQAAIEAWNDAIKDTAAEPVVSAPTAPTILKTAQTMTISQELANAANPLKSNTVSINVSSAMVNAPMVKAVDGFGDYLYVPDDGANATLSATDNSAGVAMMNIRLPAAGSYRIWGYVLAADNNSNAFYAGISQMGSATQIGGIRTWDITANANPTWRMMPGTIAVPAAGNYTLTLRERKDGTKIYRIFVTSDTSFNGDDVASYLGVTLSFDISAISKVPNSKFLIDLSDYDMYTYLLANPRIVTSTQNIRVKNVRLMVNNVYSPQNSTYTTVDKVATPTDGKVSGFPMIVLKDKGSSMDKFHFEFEILEPYAGTVNNASLTAFQNSVYPISRANCASCHSAQRPHASPDPLTAHDYALTIVNFTTPANSRIVTEIRNGHQTIGSAQGAAIAAQYEAAIVQWRTGRGP